MPGPLDDLVAFTQELATNLEALRVAHNELLTDYRAEKRLNKESRKIALDSQTRMDRVDRSQDKNKTDGLRAKLLFDGQKVYRQQNLTPTEAELRQRMIDRALER